MASIRGIVKTLRHAWNVFATTDTKNWFPYQSDTAVFYGGRPDRVRLQGFSLKSVVAPIYERIAIDFSEIDVRHVRLDDDDRYLEDIKSALNNCLTLEPNIDQGSHAFRKDYVLSLFDQGTVAIVPVDTTINPATASFDILTMRVGKIVSWMPKHVRVSVYNENLGRRDEVTLEKRFTAISENPFYMTMNEPNSTLQRLLRKLNQLDAVDEQSSSGKLDIIIQLPYIVKSEARKAQAEQRRALIEDQLKGSKYGIAYTDGTEKVTQLNRPAENNLFEQVKYLTDQLYTQLGLTAEIMNGTADETAMLNYYSRTIQPLLDAYTESMRRAFLTKTARTQGQSIVAFRDPFKLVPISQIAEIADKFTRNEIVSSNEIRQAIGMKPSKDPQADELRNSNMPQPTDPSAVPDQQPPMKVRATVGDPNQKQLTSAPSGS